MELTPGEPLTLPALQETEMEYLTMTSTIQRNLFSSLVFTLLFSLAAPCFADAASEAKTLYFQARELFDDGKYADALAMFQKSYRLQPKSSVLLSIGACQQSLGDNVAAVKTYEQVIEMTSAKKTHVEQAREKKAKLEEVIGYLEVVGAPDGAVVYVDMKRIGVAPLPHPVAFNEGEHTLEVKLAGHEPFSKIVEITSGAPLKYNVILRPAKGSIAVSCPRGTVSVDGMEKGECPVVVSVSPGTHEVAVTAQGKLSTVQTVEVAPEKTVKLEIAELKSEPSVGAVVQTDSSENVQGESDHKKTTPAFLIAGAVSLAAGAAGIGVGIAFTVRSQDNYDHVVSYIDLANQAKQDGDREAYNSYVAQYLDAKEYWETEQNPADRAGIIAGYVVGGALMVTGAVLLGIHVKKKKAEKVSFAPAPGGLVVSF